MVRHKVIIAFPGPRPESFEAARMLFCHPGSPHDLEISNSGNSWDNFNTLWSDALNSAEKDEATHFAMVHADVEPGEGWLDTSLAELDAKEADLISCSIRLKEGTGLLSCGVGNPANRWNPHFRFTVKESLLLPETWNVADALNVLGPCGGAQPDWPLLHNNGCWVADLRRPIFHRTDGAGNLLAWFDFRRRITRKPDGKLSVFGESEDWFFSRQLNALGAKTFITRKVKTNHKDGSFRFGNWLPVGQEHDDEARSLWPSEAT